MVGGVAPVKSAAREWMVGPSLEKSHPGSVRASASVAVAWVVEFTCWTSSRARAAVEEQCTAADLLGLESWGHL